MPPLNLLMHEVPTNIFSSEGQMVEGCQKSTKNKSVPFILLKRDFSSYGLGITVDARLLFSLYQITSEANLISTGILVKPEQGSRDFTFWLEERGSEGGRIAPASFTWSRDPENTFSSDQKSTTHMGL